MDGSGGAVSLVFRHFPLFTVHPFALTAALAAEASGDRFWTVHDLLFAHQNRLTDPDLEGYAREAGVAGEVVGEAAQRFKPAITADYRSGVAAGVRGTPTLFIDGELWTGPAKLRELRAAIGLPA